MKTIVGLFLFFSLTANAQFNKNESFAKKTPFQYRKPVGSFSFGMAGEGLFLSASFDIRVVQVKDVFLSARLGAGLHFFGHNTPHSLSVNYGKQNLFLELGLGRNVAYTKAFFSTFVRKDEWLYGIIGIKYQRLKKRTIYRLYTNPMFDIGKLDRDSDGNSLIFENKKIMMYAGFSIGVLF